MLSVSASVGCAAAELAGSYSVKTFRFCFACKFALFSPTYKKALLFVAYCADTAYTRLRLASGSVTRTRVPTPPTR